MLQIISGKFFSDKGIINERETYSVLYSNYSWIAPINVQIGELAPAGFSRSHISPFILRYMNRYEQRPGEILVLATDEDVTTQFRLLASFWFRAFFYPDRNYVELLCRPGPRTAQDKTVPRHFVPRFFDTTLMGTAEEVVGFPPFVKQVLGLPRKKYNLFMSCLGVFFDALEAIGTNFDLAYSMYVYLLEALSQTEQGPPAAWDDYDQQVRVRLDDQLARVEANVAANIREILVTSSHLRLTKRFVEFVLGHVEDSYFTAQAEQIRNAVPRSYLKRALENLYRTRSGYVHSLKELETALQFPPRVESADIVPGRDEPYFTFSGLVRLCRHVLFTFLNRQEYVEKEPDYPWRSELPGTIQARLAPQYWIWQDANFTPPHAKARLAGLIEHLVYSPNAPPPDMRKVLERIEATIHIAKAAHRPAMMMLYWLWNALMPDEYKGAKWDDLASRFNAAIEKCGIEAAAVLLLVNQQTPDEWSLTDLIAVVERYQRSRYKPLELHLPLPVEIGLLANIANKQLAAGDMEGFKQWTERAIMDAAGRKSTQETLHKCMENDRQIDIRAIIGWPLPSMMPAAGEETSKAEDNNGQSKAEGQEQQPLDENQETINKGEGEPVSFELVTPSTEPEPTSVESAQGTQAGNKHGEKGQGGD